METIATTSHIVVSVILIGLVLLQQGKGANAGAVFGGGGDTVFGASGAGSALTKVTTAIAIVFFGLTLYLAYENKNRDAFEGAELLDALPTSAELVAETEVVPEESQSVGVEMLSPLPQEQVKDETTTGSDAATTDVEKIVEEAAQPEE